MGTIAGKSQGQLHRGRSAKGCRSSRLRSGGTLCQAGGSLGNTPVLLKGSSAPRLPSHAHAVIHVGATFSARAHVAGTNIIF